MNWEAMGAIGEIVGAVGVIATLGYLAFQVRQNSNVTRSATRQAISSVQADLGLRIAESADLRAALASLGEIEILTTEMDAAIRDSTFFRALMRIFENQYHHTKTAPSMPTCGSAIASASVALVRRDLARMIPQRPK